MLQNIGQFSATDTALFERFTVRKNFKKNDILLKEGEICQSVFFILSGSFFQFQYNVITETIIDLHLPNEWMFNHQSLIEQSPSKTVIKAFSKSEVAELSLSNLHSLIANRKPFCILGKFSIRQIAERIFSTTH